jgi:hypothetical protein
MHCMHKKELCGCNFNFGLFGLKNVLTLLVRHDLKPLIDMSSWVVLFALVKDFLRIYLHFGTKLLFIWYVNLYAIHI